MYIQYTNKEEQKKYEFVVDSQYMDIKIVGDKLFSNDVYVKYNAIANLKGELIVCNDITKINDSFIKKIVPETFQEYQEIIANHDFAKEQWVYNILDGISEQEKIIYKDDKIVIVPCYKWNQKDLQQMHLLLFPINKSIHTLRDLNENHIELLEHAKIAGLKIIKSKYGFDSNIIKMYIHYAPTTYHLHIHFALITNNELNSSVEYSYELTSVITNIKIKSDYYQDQNITINKRI